MPPKKTSKNTKWTDPEVIALLNTLLEKKSSHQSGNGWKPSGWPDVVKAVQLVNPNAIPAKDQTKVMSKLDDLKNILTLYLFVEKFSGTGWDEEEKHAVNTSEYIKDFLTTHGKDYARCFKKSCLFYSELNELYDSLKNCATGEHVVHFPCKSRSRTSGVKNNNPAAAAASTSTAKAPTPNETAPSDSPAKLPTKRTRTESDDDEPNDPADPKGKHRRIKSDSSTTSTRGCNADTASQLARSVDSLSAAMLKPIVTTQDILYVNNVMLVLNDPTANLLPPDPHGKLFNLVSKALTASQTQAQIFILASDHSHR
ncbi:hypothetical protein DFH08DRAFT_965698 [Mycena albidolilacea]|uniref:Myb/SANT-like domain-containing protein n=1 Tax=Mycena albidolilacea TaxID=1033008 RepID=A0AAD6ZRL4_9AGAR|nr:hypothetical protein DFH08DRAFT_965698 [Mycena albidolilacea]